MDNLKQKIEYLELIKKSLRLAWRNKYLWWFGFFIALTNGGGSYSYSTDRKDWEKMSNSKFGEIISHFVADHWSSILAAIFFLAILFLCFFVISIISRAALIKSIDNLSRQQKGGFRNDFAVGKRYFWKLFGLGILLSFSVLAVVVLMMVPIVFLMILKSYLLGTILIFGAIVILLPLIFIAGFLRIYGTLYLVLSELSVWHSIENAYALLRKNIRSSIIMTMIFFILGFVSTIAVVAILIPLAIIFFVFGVILFLILKSIGIGIAVGLGALTFFFLYLIFRSFYETFAQALWFNFFHEIAKPKAEEVIAEIAEAASDKDKKLAPDASPDPVIFLDK